MQNKKSSLESLIMVILVVVTTTQFGIWGYQSFFYILSKMFNVNTASTPLDLFIGIVAMIGSVFIILGVSYRIIGKVSAKKWLSLGVSLFIVKNIIDLINDLIVFKATTVNIDEYAIQGLAGTMGVQLAELAFWVFILLYFKTIFNNEVIKTTSVSTPTPTHL